MNTQPPHIIIERAAEREEIEDSRTPIYINNKCRELKCPVDIFSEGASWRIGLN